MIMSGNSIVVDYEGKNLYVGAYGKSTGPTPSYDNISFYVGGEDFTPQGIAFNNDGTKLFMIGFATDTIYQYSLPTPYILTGMFYDNISFYAGGEDAIPRGMAFNNDGTKLFMIGSATDIIYQYSLPTPYILTGMFYDNISFYIGGEDATSLGIAFNNDGTKLFIVGAATDTIYQYSLPTPYILTGMFYDNISFYIGGEDATPRGMAFNNDGTKLFIVGVATDIIYQYSLPTPYILIGMFYDNISFYIGGEDFTPRGIAFNNDGTKLFMIGSATDTIYQYSLPMYYNLDTTRGAVFRFTGDKDYSYTFKEAILPRKGKTRYNDISPSKFGWSIAIDKHGKVLIVGAKDDSETESGSGAVYVYKRDTSLDTYTIKIKQTSVIVDHHVGSSVTISDDGSTIISGASRV